MPPTPFDRSVFQDLLSSIYANNTATALPTDSLAVSQPLPLPNVRLLPFDSSISFSVTVTRLALIHSMPHWLSLSSNGEQGSEPLVDGTSRVLILCVRD